MTNRNNPPTSFDRVARIDVVAGIRTRLRELEHNHQDLVVAMLCTEFPGASVVEICEGMKPLRRDGVSPTRRAP